MVDIIGASFDLCGMWPGSRLGPAAIRLANLRETLEGLGYAVRDLGDISGPEPHTEEGGLRNFAPLLSTVRVLRSQTLASLEKGHLPLVLGGEHTLALGCVSAALSVFADDLALLWIDAHADINTPGSSLSGNIHGMPLAALCGMDSETEGQAASEWHELLAVLGEPKLRVDRIAWYGLRDVDEAECDRLAGLAITMHDIDRHGVETTLNNVDAWMRRIGAKRLWVSFDVDALDPILAPGTGTAVRGGLSYREAHLCAELLWECFQQPDQPYELAGVDVVETNPLRDTNNATAIMAVEWIASLLGKSILTTRRRA